LHAYMKYQNYVTRFSFPYFDMPKVAEGFERRERSNEQLPLDSMRKRGASQPVAWEELKQAPSSTSEFGTNASFTGQAPEPEVPVSDDLAEQRNLNFHG